MSQEAFVRARRPEHKQQRREAILAAARELALRSGVRNVSLGGVAAAVGLAKSNLARYFGTREEIYLALAAEEWQGWQREVTGRLADAAGTRDAVTALTETLVARPLLCDLLSQAATALEHNISISTARAFKLEMLAGTRTIGAAVARACPGLTEDEGVELAGAAAAFAALLYPVANPAPVLAELYATDPEVAAACLPFTATMTRMLSALAAGLPTLREAAPPA